MNRRLLLPCVGAALIWTSALVVTTVDRRYAEAFITAGTRGDSRFSDEIVSARGILQITYRNTRAILYNAAGGFSGGIYTVLNLAVNGGSLGIFISAARANGFDWNEIANYTLPHFAEYLALWLSGGVGFAICLLLVASLVQSKPPKSEDLVSLAVAMGISEMFVLMGAAFEVWVSVGVRTL